MAKAEKREQVIEKRVVQVDYKDPRAPAHQPQGRGGEVVLIRRIGWRIFPKGGK